MFHFNQRQSIFRCCRWKFWGKSLLFRFKINENFLPERLFYFLSRWGRFGDDVKWFIACDRCHYQSTYIHEFYDVYKHNSSNAGVSTFQINFDVNYDKNFRIIEMWNGRGNKALASGIKIEMADFNEKYRIKICTFKLEAIKFYASFVCFLKILHFTWKKEQKKKKRKKRWDQPAKKFFFFLQRSLSNWRK